MNTMSTKETIIHLPPQEAQMWCTDAMVSMQGLLMKSMNQRDQHPSTLFARECTLIVPHGSASVDWCDRKLAAIGEQLRTI
jgi:hypothetical protein